MTVIDPDTTAVDTIAPRRRDPLQALPASVRFALYASVLVFVLAAAEQLGDTNRLTLANTWESALQLTIPIALAGLGGLWAERAGVVNIGLEGMMVLGTWMGAWGCIEFGPWTGVLLGVLGGAFGGLIHAIATVVFGVDHIVSGVALNILGAGAAQFINLEVYDSTNQSPTIPDNVADIRIPGLNDLVHPILGADLTSSSLLVWLALLVVGLVVAAVLLRPAAAEDLADDDREETGRGRGGALRAALRPVTLAVLGLLVLLTLIELAPYFDEQERFFISELGRILVGLTAEVSLVVVLGVLAFPITAFVLWRTKFGLRLRSVGEDPIAAESLGVNVYLMKFTAVIMSGALAGLGGVSLVYVFAQKFQSGQTNGRGYIGLAAMIFGNWRPGGLAMGAGLFGFTDALSLQNAQATRALLLVVALGAAFLVLRGLITGRWKAAIIAIVGGVASFLWFQAVDELPGELVTFLPHLTTLLVLTFASQRLRPPAADGQVYRRGGSG